MEDNEIYEKIETPNGTTFQKLGSNNNSEFELFVWLLHKAIIIGLIALCIITIRNIVALPILTHFGFSQYCNNIVHLESDNYLKLQSYKYLKLQSSFTSFEVPVTISQAENKDKAIGILNSGQIVHYYGYKRSNYITWVAVKYFNNDSFVYCWIYLPKDIGIKFFGLGSKEGYFNVYDTEPFSEKRKQKYKTELLESININIVSKALDKQKLIESPSFKSDYVKLKKQYPWKTENQLVFVSKNDFQKVEMIYDKYLSRNNIEKAILQKH